MCVALAALYAGCLMLSFTRRFFALSVPTAGMVATAAIASAAAIGGLWLSGFSLWSGTSEATAEDAR